MVAIQETEEVADEVAITTCLVSKKASWKLWRHFFFAPFFLSLPSAARTGAGTAAAVSSLVVDRRGMSDRGGVSMLPSKETGGQFKFIQVRENHTAAKKYLTIPELTRNELKVNSSTAPMQ